MSEKLWYKVARNFIKVGRLPIPVNDTVITIIKTMLTEEQANFISLFRKSSYNMEQLIKSTKLDEGTLLKKLKELMKLGVVSGFASKTTGVMVYRLLPLLPGVIETTFMTGKTGDKEIKLAQLYNKFFNEMVEGTQKHYDQMISEFQKGPSITRIIPVEEEVEVLEEKVFQFEEVSEIIKKYDTIGVAVCYCRHQKDLLNEPCQKTDDRENCLMLGRTAEFFIENDFAKPISKEEAIKILRKAEDEGLVHKAFHSNLDLEREIDGLCNCCKCCCGTFDTHYSGAWPIMDYTSYKVVLDEDLCTGCGTCVEACNNEALELNDIPVTIIEERCIGCGVCAHLCPEKALKLNRIEPQRVFVPPPKLNT